MGAVAFLLVYILGGLTIPPILLGLILLHVYLTFPVHSDSSPSTPTDRIRDISDDDTLKSAPSLASPSFAEKFQRSHEADVAAGYFAVCREYVPGGINGKPPERTTPAGAVVAMESPSVYQTMYRSIFDRKQGPSLDPGRGNGRTVKRARNVFFVVLRHGHLMLYDDSEQVEVRLVISLAHHTVSIYGGAETIPEGELWIKRNAICLAKKSSLDLETKPYYFFSENCCDKEDFYFALLQNQEIKHNTHDNPPRPQQYEVKDIITLVQKLHSSEEQLQTRWINALIGRGFLALYKTQAVEDLVRDKITKKISRVKKPAFLSSIVLKNISMGESAPFITNPRLKELTIDGDCYAEADVKYSGNFRLEIAATARIDLGARFKVREVNLLLAVVVKKIEGHGLIRFKPPPSNRVWVSFETMPDMEMTIEPIVSSRQITYTIILRAIESRIREVIAETLVNPHWDDVPFTNTEHQEFRGGIWVRPKSSSQFTTSAETVIPEVAPEDELPAGLDSILPLSPKSRDSRTLSMPTLFDPNIPEPVSKKSLRSTHTLHETLNSAVTSGSEKRAEPPKAIRSRSFASAANPLVSLDNVSIDSVKFETKTKHRPDATSAMMAISSRSQPTSPADTPVGSPQEPSILLGSHKPRGHSSSNSSKASSIPEFPSKPSSNLEQGVSQTTSSNASRASTFTTPPSPTHRSQKSGLGDELKQAGLTEKSHSIAALGAATLAAKKWGWGVLNRNTDQKTTSDGKSDVEREGTPEHPIGRGRPLPPPGQPLPLPERPSTKILQNGLSKRKAAPPPLPQRRKEETKARAIPALPARRKPETAFGQSLGDEGLLVVEAPADSQPSTPGDDDREDFAGHFELTTDEKELKTPSALHTVKRTRSDEDKASLIRHQPSLPPRADET